MKLSPPGTKPSNSQTPCEKCSLLKNSTFRKFTSKEMGFIQKFKTGELVADPGTTLLLDGTNSAHLYTILTGWIFRYKMLEDGRRQILNFGMPGDFIGLQTSIFNEMDHSVETLTEVVLCVFSREKVWTLFNKHPELAFDITWLAAREERLLDDNLLTVGRRTALERVAFIITSLFHRAEQLGMTNKNEVYFPFTQTHLADALGLSQVHTNKTIKKLVDKRLIEWKSSKFKIKDRDALIELAHYDHEDPTPRPFI